MPRLNHVTFSNHASHMPNENEGLFALLRARTSRDLGWPPNPLGVTGIHGLVGKMGYTVNIAGRWAPGCVPQLSPQRLC